MLLRPRLTVENGATASYGAVTDFTEFWRDWSEITSFPLIDTSFGANFGLAWLGCSSLTSFPLIDTSSGTNFNYAWRDCSSLTGFPLIDTSSGTYFEKAWRDCTSLTSFPANAFDNIKGGDFSSAFNNTALTQTSIDNILVSLVASGIAAGTRVFNQSGGSAPSATGAAAIDTLRSRGWTVTVTGGGATIAPTITSAPQITGDPVAGETVSITNATASGTPAPTITPTLALGGTDVTGDMAGGAYQIPPGTTVGTTLTLTSVASNGVSPDAQDSVSVTIIASYSYSYRTEQINP